MLCDTLQVIVVGLSPIYWMPFILLQVLLVIVVVVVVVVVVIVVVVEGS